MPGVDDFDFDEDSYTPARDVGFDDDRDEGCVLGAECCCPHIFHGPDECFTAEMAEAFFAEPSEPEGDRG